MKMKQIKIWFQLLQKDIAKGLYAMRKRSCRYVSFITAAALMTMTPFSVSAEEVVVMPDEAAVTEENSYTEGNSVSAGGIDEETKLVDDDGHPRGLVLPKNDNREVGSVIEKMGDSRINIMEDLPEKYPEDIEALPELRAQAHGTCWAYSAIATAEMDLLTDGLVDNTVDLSEMHTAYFTKYFNKDTVDPLGTTSGDMSYADETDYLESGGNQVKAFNTMATWSGLAEQDDVVDERDATADTELAPEDQYGISKYHLQGIYELYKGDRELIKQNILDHGAVTGMYYSGDYDENRKNYYYTETKNGYYCPYSYCKPDHAITIVGWDDDFDKEWFSHSPSTPSENGAWLIRNSWTNGGHAENYNGFFWMSYCDKSLYKYLYAVDIESADNYDHNYQYDGGNYYGGYFAYGGQDAAANVFTVSANKDGKIEELNAIGFTTFNSQNVDYTADIYVNLTDENDPISGILADSISGNILYTGYYTVSTNKPIKLVPGTKFSVVVSLKANADTISKPYLANEYSASDTSSYGTEIFTVSMQKAQSFAHYLDYRGESVWKDISDEERISTNIGNYRIKAFTNDTNEDAVMPESVTLNKNELKLYVDDTAKLEATVSPDDATYNYVVFTSSDESVATVDDDGTVTAVGLGTASISAYDAFGIKSDVCKVTVEEKPAPEDDPSDDKPSEDKPSHDTPSQNNPSQNSPSGNDGVSYDRLPSYATASSDFIVAYGKINVSLLLKGNLGAKARYKSSNKKIAKVSRGGMVTGKSTGDVVISLEEKVGKAWTAVSSCKIHVEKPLMTKKKDVTIGSEFSAEDLMSGATYAPTMWVSSKPSVATVTADGKVKILGRGKAKIYAIYSTQQGSTGKKYKTTLRAR